MRQRRLSLAWAMALCLLVATLGCARDDGLKPEERQMANRLDEITRKSGGDWDKLSDSEKRYLIQDISHGSEPSARMLLMARGGKLRGKPGGAPRP